MRCHEKPVLICERCHKAYKRIDHYTDHMGNCTAATSSFTERSVFDSVDSTRDETEQQTVDESDQDIIEQNFQALANAGPDQFTGNAVNLETEKLIETNELETSLVNGCLQNSTGINSQNQSDLI